MSPLLGRRSGGETAKTACGKDGGKVCDSMGQTGEMVVENPVDNVDNGA